VKSIKWLASYVVVAGLGLGIAFFASLHFMAPAHSQGAPSNGDLPPEFAKEINNNKQAPAQASPAPAHSPAAALPPTPPPAAAVVNAAPAEPPPPPSQSPKTPGAANAQNIPTQQQTAPPQQPPPPQDAVIDNGATALGPMPTYVVPKDGYAYDPTGKRDPFKPFHSLTDDAKKVILEPLQKWDLDRLKVVGILWEVRNPRAMVKDPDGVLHIVTKDTKIGRNEGYVAAVREGEIVVIETKYTETGAKKETYIMEFRK